MKNARPVIIILLFLCVLLFLAGFNLGKKIQKMDQVYIPPTLVPTESKLDSFYPTPTSKPLSYRTYTLKECGVEFLYPENLNSEQESSSEASLSYGNEQIFVSCNKKTYDTVQKKITNAEKIETYESSTGKITVYRLEELDAWTIFNPQTSKKILFEASPHITRLVIRTLKLQ